MKHETEWAEAVSTAAQMGGLDVTGMPWAGGPDGKPGILMRTDEAKVLTELASYAVRRGYSKQSALQEIASRYPHPFKGSLITCTDCGRSEIFSKHTKEIDLPAETPEGENQK